MIEPTVNGQTFKNQSIVLCFPERNVKEVIRIFQTLFLKKYVEAINREEELSNVQKFGRLHNMPVQYFTPFMLYNSPGLSKFPVYFANINKNGVSYNKFDVSTKFSITIDRFLIQKKLILPIHICR